MRKTNKKGQVMKQFGMIAIGIGVLAILLVVVFLINSNIKSTVSNDITATAYTDSTVTLTNATTTTFTNCVDNKAMTVTEILNGTGAGCVALGAANYTVSLNTVAMSVEGSSYEASTNITYSCKNPSLAYNATTTLNNDTYSLVTWVGLIIIILIGIMLLALVRQIRQ